MIRTLFLFTYIILVKDGYFGPWGPQKPSSLKFT